MKKSLLLLALLPSLAIAQNSGGALAEILEEKMPYSLEYLQEHYQAGVYNTAKHQAGMGTETVSEQKLSASISAVDEGEGFIAINPNDSNHLVLSYMAFGGSTVALEFPIFISRDGGLSWTSSNFKTDSVFAADFPNEIIGGGGDPVFAFDDNGRLYFSWIYLGVDLPNDRASFTLNWAYSDDGGNNFQVSPDSAHFIGAGELTNLQMGGVISNLGDGVLDRQWMAVDRSGGLNDGRLYVSALFIPNDSTTRQGLGTTVFYKEANANAFARTTFPVATAPDTQFGNVVVDSAGNAYLTYVELTGGDIKFSTKSAAAASFSSATSIVNGTDQFLNNSPYHNRANGAMNLVVDEQSGVLHLVYTDYKAGSCIGNYMRSTDQGLTWSTPTNIGSFTNGNVVLMPSIAAYDGRVSIGWYDVDSLSRKALHYSVESRDGGITWGITRQGSMDTTTFKGNIYNRWFGDYFNTVRTNCKTYNLWSDGRAGGSTKMYLSITNNCSGLSTEDISPLQSNLQVGALYPNPAQAFLKLPIEARNSGSAQWSILDLSGRELLEGSLDYKAGAQELELSLPDDLASGTYILQFQCAEGRFQRTWIKQ